MAPNAIPAKRANWFTAARWSRWAIGTTRSARPSDSVLLPAGMPRGEPRRSQSGLATLVVADEEGYLYFVGRKDEMIKTSGYRVSPTEIEEEAYATGLVRDAVALGVDDAKLGQRILLVASPAGSGRAR